jgi:hypothetical protein
MKCLTQASGVYTTTFDQCMYGLVTKVRNTPVLKSTKIVFNLKTLQSRFSMRCDKSHVHQNCSGSEGGEFRAVFAQRYPDKLCQAVADAVVDAVADAADAIA